MSGGELGPRAPVTSCLLGHVDGGVLIAKWWGAITACRYSGKVTSKLQETRTVVEKRLANCEEGSLEQKVLIAWLGDEQSMIGRWKGDIEEAKQGLKKVWDLLHYLERRSNQFGDYAIAQARGWLGCALTRRAYLTRLPWHHQRASRMLVGAREACDRAEGTDNVSILRANITRDLGDSRVGELVWDREPDVHGFSVMILRDAVAQFEELYRAASEKDKSSLELELAAARSSLAVACMFTVERWSQRTERKVRFAPEFESKESPSRLTTEAMTSIKAVWGVYVRARDTGRVPFRWARVLNYLGFASHFVFRAFEEGFVAEDNDENEEDWSKLSGAAFDNACGLYSKKDQPFRLAVTQEGVGNLYRDMFVCCGDDERRDDLRGRAVESWRDAELAFERCDAAKACSYASARATECRDKQGWLLSSERNDLTELPDLWLDYGKWKNNGQEEEILEEEFQKAVAAAQVGRTRVMELLAAKVAHAQRYPPSRLEDRQAFMKSVNDALHRFGLALKIGDKYSRMLRIRNGSLQLSLPGGVRGFVKAEIEVVGAPGERRGRAAASTAEDPRL